MRNTLLALMVCGLAMLSDPSYAKEAAPAPINTDYEIHEWG
jgi:hypothetical protein